MINRTEIRRIVIESLLELVSRGKEIELPVVNEATDPIKNLGLCSEDGIELACLLSLKLGFEIPHELNPIKDDARRRPRRVGEIVEFLLNLIDEKGIVNNA
jgi:hypothetical protein